MMTNVERLRVEGNESARIFADAIESFSLSQGFYARLICSINEMEEAAFLGLKSTIEAENFKDTLDVIFFMEGCL